MLATVNGFLDAWEKDERDEFNASIARRYERIRDYIVCHYRTAQRADTDYWRDATGFDGQTVWVNHLAGQCPSLTELSTIVMERSGPQTCRGDAFRTVEHGTGIPSGHCVLGDFTPHRAL